MFTDISVFFGFIGLFIYLGLRDSPKIKTETSYLLADRKTKLFPLVATLVMTEFNPSTLLGFSSVGYVAGIWGISLPFVFLSGLLFYTIAVAVKWKRLDSSSVAELFTLRYGEKFGKLASSLLLLALLGFSANYIKSIQMIFLPLKEISNYEIPGYLVSLISIVVIGLITLRGGLVSIIKTDVGSFLCTLLFIPMLYYFSIPDNKTTEITLDQGMNAVPPNFVLSLVVLTMFTYIAAPWYGQKIFSAENEKIALYAVGISSFLVFLLYSIPILAVYNLYMLDIKITNAESGIPYIINHLFPEGFRGFAYSILFLAGATTLSGVWSSMTTMIVTDFLGKRHYDSTKINRSIFITLFIMIISFLISEFFIDKILDKLILANIPIAALSFGLLAGFYWENASRVGLVASTIIGNLWGIFCYLYFGESGGYTFYWAIYGIPMIFGTGILFSLLFSRSMEEKELYSRFKNRMSN